MSDAGCDGCGEPFGDAWCALGIFGPIAMVAFVCPTCAPILERIDALVDYGHLTPDQAAAEFERARWARPLQEAEAHEHREELPAAADEHDAGAPA